MKEHVPADVEETDMADRPILRILVKQVELIGLLLQYVYLRIRLVQLRIYYYLLKAAGAALIEVVKLEYCIKSLSKYDRVVFATCIAISIYLLAQIILSRM